jgi:hypothetical protein
MVLGGTANMSGDRRPSERPSREMEDDATSPLKQKTTSARRGEPEEPLKSTTSKQLFQDVEVQTGPQAHRKRKSKTASRDSSVAPDLNLPAEESLSVVPVGLVSSRVGQLHGIGGSESPATTSDELTEKKKRSSTHSNARSAAATEGSPRRAQ